MAKEVFRSAMTHADLIDSDTVSTIVGQFVKLGEYQVQAGEEVALGYGPHTSQENAVGRTYMLFKDGEATPGEIKGLVRISAYSPQDRPLKVLAEFRTEQTSQGATDVTLRIPNPENVFNLREDQKIVLEFKADAAATLTKANCSVLVDVTKYVV